MTKTEWDGIPQLRILQAIIDLREKHKQRATSRRIAPLINRTVNNASHMLAHFWDMGYVRRIPMRRRRIPGQEQKETHGCQFHYMLTKKGERRLEQLKSWLGGIDKPNLQKPGSRHILPSDLIPASHLNSQYPALLP